MGILSHLFYPWGLLLQAAAIIHFIRRRPDTYWIYIILFLGPVGALVYLFAEALPDVGLLNQSFKGISRRKHIKALELVIRDNPSAGNYEELGELYLEEGKLQAARQAFDKAISARSTTLDCFYKRGMCTILLGDATTALPDLEYVVSKEPNYDFHRAPALLAQAYALTGQKGKVRSALSPRDVAFHAVGDLPELRGPARIRRPQCGSKGVGAESSGQAADDAAIPATA